MDNRATFSRINPPASGPHTTSRSNAASDAGHARTTGTNSDGPRGKKRVNDEDLEPFFHLWAEQNSRLPKTHAELEAANWRPSGLNILPDISRSAGLDFDAVQTLSAVPDAEVVYRHQEDEVSLLETVDRRVNWIATDPERTAPNGRIIKVATDRASILALANTLMEYSRNTGSRFLHLRMEGVSSLVSHRHAQQLDNMEQQALAAMTAAVRTTPVPHCTQCGKAGHETMACVMPDPVHGSVKLCPLCNTKDHPFDFCGKLHGVHPSDEGWIRDILNLVMHQRGNRPQVRSARWVFHDLLVAGTNMGLVPNSQTTVLRWPWSNEFATKVAQARAGDPILQGKMHPADFDHSRHTADDLPADPLFAGKTIAQIAAMAESGALDRDWFVPVKFRQVTEVPVKEEETGGVARRAMVTPGANSEQRTPWPRSERRVGALRGAKRIKREEDHMYY